MAPIQDDVKLWHRGFGHLSYGNLQKMADDQLVDRLNVEAKAFRSHETCEQCILAMQGVKPFEGSKGRRCKGSLMPSTWMWTLVSGDTGWSAVLCNVC
jgi:hypothetical protein